MDYEAALPYLTGPASGLLICLLIGLGVYKLIRDAIVPMVKVAIDRNLTQIDAMVERHGDEHRAIITVLERTEQKIGGLYGKIDDLKDTA